MHILFEYILDVIYIWQTPWKSYLWLLSDYILSCVWVTIDGVWIGDWITCNYSAIANLYTSQITTVHSKPSQSNFTSRFPVTASSSVDSTASMLMPLPADHSLTTKLNSNLVSLITHWHGPRRKHYFQPFLYCFAWILGFPRDRYPASPLARWLLPGKGCFLVVCFDVFF
jgi:hypothetical protein